MTFTAAFPIPTGQPKYAASAISCASWHNRRKNWENIPFTSEISESVKGACKFSGSGKEVNPMRRLFLLFLSFLAAWSGWLLFCFQRTRGRRSKKGPKSPSADTEAKQED